MKFIKEHLQGFFAFVERSDDTVQNLELANMKIGELTLLNDKLNQTIEERDAKIESLQMELRKLKQELSDIKE